MSPAEAEDGFDWGGGMRAYVELLPIAVLPLLFMALTLRVLPWDHASYRWIEVSALLVWANMVYAIGLAEYDGNPTMTRSEWYSLLRSYGQNRKAALESTYGSMLRIAIPAFLSTVFLLVETWKARASALGASLALRRVAGMLGFFALFVIVVKGVRCLLNPETTAADIVHLNSLLMFVTAPVGWGGLLYVCWDRFGRVAHSDLALVLALGCLGTVVSLVVIKGGPYAPYPGVFALALVVLMGTWMLNGIGIVWTVYWMRGIQLAANR